MVELVEQQEKAEQKQQQEKLLSVSRQDKYHTVSELLDRSQPSSLYYTLLLLSAAIISAGLLLGNSSIVIGGMLITPVLVPILVIALGVSVGEPRIIKKPLDLLFKSSGVVIGISALMTLLFGLPNDTSFLPVDSTRTALLYFVVALVAGIAATLAWTRKEISEVMPGIAIAVSLVPPLALTGIFGMGFELGEARFYLTVFLLNLLGIIMGSIVVFSLLKFYQISDTSLNKGGASEK